MRSTLSLCPAGMLSRSRVIISRPATLLALRRGPLRAPPTKPPISLRSSCCAFLRFRYSARVSVPLAGTFNFCHNSDTISVCVVHTVARLLAPEAMAILRSYCIAVTPYRPHPRRGGLNHLWSCVLLLVLLPR